MKKVKAIYFALFVVLCLSSEWLLAGTEEITFLTFDGKKFSFPVDIKGRPLSLLFLAMADNRNDGESQQKILVDWYLALEDAGVFTDRMSVYYFSVVNKAPFFVKKIISNAIADVYKEIVSPSRLAVIFAKDINVFKSVSKSAVNEGPSLILLSLENEVILELNGSLDESKMKLLEAEIDTYYLVSDEEY
ncbi:MAG: hypothetical protein KUG76_01500 [Gammaproteobacteria bacterium]|nr:hypothetical protein [Gammaproteobacteria bacterium]